MIVTFTLPTGTTYIPLGFLDIPKVVTLPISVKEGKLPSPTTYYKLPTKTIQNCCQCQPTCHRSNANLSFIYMLKRNCQFNIEMFEILNLLELLYRNLWLPFKQKFCTFLLVVTENFKLSVSQSVSSLNLRTV